MLSCPGFSHIPLQTSLILLIFLILACRFTAHSLSIFVYFFFKKLLFIYTFRRFYVQTLYVRYFYTLRRNTFSIYTLRFIRSDVIRSDVIRSVFIRLDVIRSDVIRSVIIRSVGESVIVRIG